MTRRRTLALGALFLLLAAGTIGVSAVIAGEEVIADEEARMVFHIEGMR